MNLGKHKHSDCSKRKANKEGQMGRKGKCRKEEKEERKKNGRQAGKEGERKEGRKTVTRIPSSCQHYWINSVKVGCSCGVQIETLKNCF